VVLSTRNAEYHHNIVTNNDTYGFAIIDQKAFDALAGGALGGSYSHTCEAPDAPFVKCNPANAAVDCPLSLSCVEDQKLEFNSIYFNQVVNNGGPNAAPGSVGAGNGAYAIIEEGPSYANDNCIDGILPLNRPLGNDLPPSCS
jgi:hypothetical protein